MFMITKKIVGKVQQTMLDSLDVVLRKAEETSPTSVNSTVEIYMLKDPNEMLPLFPQDKDGGYLLPLDVHPAIPAFVYYGEKSGDIPKMIVVANNIVSDESYMRNYKGLIGHELGHLLSWNKKIENNLKLKLEKAVNPKKFPEIDDLVDIVAQTRAEDVAINAGYDSEMLDLRATDMEKAYDHKIIYEHKIVNAMTLFASFRLIEKKTTDKKLRERAKSLANKLDLDFSKKLESGHKYYKLLKEFTIWTVDSEAYNDFKKLLSYKRFNG